MNKKILYMAGAAIAFVIVASLIIIALAGSPNTNVKTAALPSEVTSPKAAVTTTSAASPTTAASTSVVNTTTAASTTPAATTTSAATAVNTTAATATTNATTGATTAAATSNAPAATTTAAAPANPTTPKPAAPTTTVAAPAPQPAGAGAVIVPARLKVPAIGVDAKIEQVGLDKSGAMASPVDYFQAGWYKLGYKPGQTGNAVLAGHVDSAKYGKAIFWDLKTLKVGSKIYVQDEAGKELEFEVYDMQSYPFDNAPLEKIFGPSQNINLNIITCGGEFDQQTRNYDKRLVVYTKLVK